MRAQRVVIPSLLGSVFILLLILTSTLYGQMSTSGADASSQEPIEESGGTIPDSCRYGVTAIDQTQLTFVDDLAAGWLLYFGGLNDQMPPNVEEVPLVTVKQKKLQGQYLNDYIVSPPLTDAGLGQIIDNRPGYLWMVGNEVDRGPSPGGGDSGQGDMYPHIYARAYHDVYHFIKDRDPTAQVSNSPLVEVTPGRLQYLDLMWNAYLDRYGHPMPVDVWNMHVYILPEADLSGIPNGIANVALGTDVALAKLGPGQHESQCPNSKIYCYAEHDSISIFAEQVLAMRKWLYEHGQKHKPLILSEFSLLYPYIQESGGCFLQDEQGNCFTESRVQKFLNDSISYLESATHSTYGHPLDGHRLVQQWNWYSIWVDNVETAGYVSNLVDSTSNSLTNIGIAFRDRAKSQQPFVNLLPAGASHPAVFTDPGTSTAEAYLEVTVANNGTYTPDSPFDIAFYEDRAMTRLIGTVTVPAPGINGPGVQGCVRRTVKSGVTWSDLPPGKHNYWAHIDSGHDIPELTFDGNGEGDNVIKAYVLVDPEQMILPFVSR